MLFGTLFYICEMLYIYGFVIVGQKYQSSFLVGTSWILVASVAAQIPSSFAILLSPGFGTEPLPWFFYACNFCEGLAGVAFGVSLIRLRIRIGRRATLTGVATIILYVCYAISSTPQLATELVLLASVGTGLLVLSDYLSM